MENDDLTGPDDLGRLDEQLIDSGLSGQHPVDRKEPIYVIERLAAARRRAGIELPEMAAILETSVSDVLMLERGEGNPSLSRLQRYARAVRCDVTFELVKEDGWTPERRLY